MDAPSPHNVSALRTLLSQSWRGARFGGKFTFWFVLCFVTLPITANVTAKIVRRPHAWERILFSDQGIVRYVMPAILAPTAGAGMGAVVAAILFPLAGLLDSRGSSGRWEGYEPRTPLDDIPLVPRSREELLRRIVLHGPPDMTQPELRCE
jgi:hypothetical protein